VVQAVADWFLSIHFNNRINFRVFILVVFGGIFMYNIEEVVLWMKNY